MKADKNGVGLECAKLLKDCGIKSEYAYIPYNDEYTIDNIEYWEFFDDKYGTGREIVFAKKDVTDRYTILGIYAPTWQEILWKYHKKFFGDQHVVFNSSSKEYENHENFQTWIATKKYREDKWIMSDKKIAYKVIPQQILEELQQEHYNQAERIFINNCILIKREKT